MSRIGKEPVNLASGVTVDVSGRDVTVKGPKGEVALRLPQHVDVGQDDGVVTVTRHSDAKPARAAHGTARQLIANAVKGVQEPYKITLEIVGVGYTSNLRGKEIGLKVGFVNEVVLAIPDGVEVKTPSAIQIVVSSCDKHKAGQLAASIRAVRPPEPYNGKGIRYMNERIQRKAGKSFASAG